MLEQLGEIFATVTWTEMAAVAAMMLLAGFVRGFVGFGASMIIVLAVSQVWTPAMAVPIATLSGLPSMVQLLPGAIRDCDREFAIPFSLASIIGTPIGTWVLVSVDPSLMKIAIATMVTLMVIVLYRGWQPKRPLGVVAFGGVGVFSGLIQGAGGIGGPPAVLVTLSRGGTPHRMRANLITVVGAISLVGIPPMIWHGLITLQVVIISIVLVPLYSGATVLGSKYFAGRGQHQFRKAALIALAVVALGTLAMSARKYLMG